MGEWALQDEVRDKMLCIDEPSKLPPRVFVGSYTRYTEGYPPGYAKWWDLDDFYSRGEFYAALNEHFSQWEPETEPMFQDYEGFPDQYYSESEIDEDLWQVYLATSEDPDLVAYSIAAGVSLEEVLDGCYFGPYDSLEDLVGEHLDEYGIRGIPIPEEIRFYINEELVLRELAIEGGLTKIGNRYYLF